MPSKRPSPLEENPPSVSSSGSSSEGEEDDSHGEEEELTPIKSSSTIPNSNSIQTPSSVTQSLALSNGGNDDGEDDSTDDDESGSDSDDSTQNNPISPSSPALDIKPISSKPMTETHKPRKPDNSVGKRSLEADGDEKDSRKEKKKKKVSDLVEEDHETNEKKSGASGGGGDHSKKFQKLWTEQDEIDILKGMIDFKKTKGDPAAHVGAFFDFLKNDLRSDVSKQQLQSKIRTLKRKYTNTLKRAKQPGEDPEISKPHEAYVYKLSKKVWPGEVGKDDEGDPKSVGVTVPSVDEKSKQKSKNVKVSDGLASSKKAKVSDGLASCEATVTELPINSAPVVVKTEDVGIACENPYLKQSFVVGNNSMLPVVPPVLGHFFSNRRSDLIENSNASELDKKWKNVMIAETEAYIDRLELVKEQTKMMLDKLKSSNC